MRTQSVAIGVLFFGTLVAAAPASAQRVPFERSYDVGVAPTIDISTIRGKINVKVGDAGHVIVSGTATVRTAWDVPANAIELARKVAEHPPIEQKGDALSLRPPSGAEERRAMTVNYDIRVPKGARIQAVSDSGAIDIRDVAGPVSVRTQSSAIDLSELGAADVETGSGDVVIDGASGAVRIKTSSSAITARGLRGGLHARTGSGRVIASFKGAGGVDIGTSSSAIELTGVSGALTTKTESGRTTVTGVPSGPWDVSAGSGSIAVNFETKINATLHASTGSGSVSTPDRLVTGSIEKRRVEGAIGTGGPIVKLASRSGSIRIQEHP